MSGWVDSAAPPGRRWRRARGALPAAAALACSLPILLESAPVRAADFEPLPSESAPQSSPAVESAALPGADAPGDAPALPAVPKPSPRVPSPLPEIAAVFPGIVIHGAGPWLQHRNRTAERLLLLEGAAVLATVTSGLVLFRTGAARDVVGPTALVGAAGVSGFAVSFLANVYATWAPDNGFGEPLRRSPLLESSLGYFYVYDPQFEYRHFASAEVSGRLAAWRATAAAAIGQDNQRLRFGAGYRLLGPRGRGAEPAADGSYLEPRIAYTHHDFDSDAFSSQVFELALEGRLDLDRYLPDVRGAFFEAEAGWAKQVFHHELTDSEPDTWTSLLLARMGFGLYFGNRGGEAAGGEAQLYYDHRHDGFAGGLKVNGLGSGPAGHFGLLASWQLAPLVGLRLRTEAGSAYIVGLDWVTRQW